MSYGRYPYPYDPYDPHYSNRLNPQQRLHEMERQYQRNYYPEYEQQQQQKPPEPEKPSSPLILSVTSEEEAKSYIPDMSGATQLFLHKNGDSVDYIYCKQLNFKTGTVDFEIFERVGEKKPEVKEPEKLLENPFVLGIVQGYDDKLNAILTEVEALKEAIK